MKKKTHTWNLKSSPKPSWCLKCIYTGFKNYKRLEAVVKTKHGAMYNNILLIIFAYAYVEN